MGADDHPQHIVEVVSNAAGQLTQRLHLLGLPKLAFGLLAAIDLLEQLLVGDCQPIARRSKRADRVIVQRRKP